VRVTKTPCFDRELFQFLRDLKKNNEREWFQAHKQRYESQVRDPVLRFIADFAPLLRKISPHYLADPRPVGGSLTRIYRDTRFSADKSPYKTMAGVLFRHEAGKSVPSPAFLLHLEPGQSFAGIGVHGPDPQTLAKIRHAIASDPDAWRAATSGKDFKATCAFMGEVLRRPPKGYGPDHPCIEDLKRKDYCTQTFFTDREVCASDFEDRFAATCSAAARFMEYLTVTLGLPW
jgi:uncharacterized protein (TIGR02453 family)